MPETISLCVKLDVLTLLSTGHTTDKVVTLMHISKFTIALAKRKQKLYGDIEGGKKKGGRGPYLHPK
jgi:hypothetical protein